MPDLTVWPTDGADGSVSSEARWRKMARVWVPSGVDPTPLATGGGSGLAPTLAAGPTINVTAGACWLDGHYAEIATPSSIPATANGLLVVRFTPADNHAELLYRDAATTCTMTVATWELPIARMAAGVLQDVRWVAYTDGSFGYASNPANTVLAAADTLAAPKVVLTCNAYCDGGPIEATFATWHVDVTGGLLRAFLFVDGVQSLIYADFQPPSGSFSLPMMLKARLTPAAGAHVITLRAGINTPATAGNVQGPNHFTLRKV